MYCRVGHIKHTGNTDEIIESLRGQEKKYDTAEGLISVTYIKISNKEFLGVPIWETKEHMDNASEIIQELMSTFMNVIEGPPDFKEGEVLWQYTKER